MLRIWYCSNFSLRKIRYVETRFRGCFNEPLGASPGFVASPQVATGASARRLTMNQQAGRLKGLKDSYTRIPQYRHCPTF